jgi:hypothetical protein
VKVEEFINNYYQQKENRRKIHMVFQDRVLGEVRALNQAFSFNMGLTREQFDQAVNFAQENKCSLDLAVRRILRKG